ncbi:MAG TPA: cytochrome c3 family protein, partial [bacterium]|nr:cytochrome c3 family protein [bacterium]
REVVVCTQTLAEMIALPAAPEGPDVEEILAILERWMAPRPGEPAVDPWPVAAEACGACGRPAGEVAQLFAADGTALCFDCARHAATGRVEDAALAAIATAEAEQALAELENLARIRAEVKNDPAIRGNATAVLSLLRILGLSDARTRARLGEIVRALDAG